MSEWLDWWRSMEPTDRFIFVLMAAYIAFLAWIIATMAEED